MTHRFSPAEEQAWIARTPALLERELAPPPADAPRQRVSRSERVDAPMSAFDGELGPRHERIASARAPAPSCALSPALAPAVSPAVSLHSASAGDARA